MAGINEKINYSYFVREPSDHHRSQYRHKPDDDDDDGLRPTLQRTEADPPSTRSFLTGATDPTMDTTDYSEAMSIRDECEAFIKEEREANNKREQGARSARRQLYSLLREEQQKRTDLEDIVQQEREERLRERRLMETKMQQERDERLKEKEERKALEAKIEFLMIRATATNNKSDNNTAAASAVPVTITTFAEDDEDLPSIFRPSVGSTATVAASASAAAAAASAAEEKINNNRDTFVTTGRPPITSTSGPNLQLGVMVDNSGTTTSGNSQNHNVGVVEVFKDEGEDDSDDDDNSEDDLDRINQLPSMFAPPPPASEQQPLQSKSSDHSIHTDPLRIKSDHSRRSSSGGRRRRSSWMAALHLPPIPHFNNNNNQSGRRWSESEAHNHTGGGGGHSGHSPRAIMSQVEATIKEMLRKEREEKKDDSNSAQQQEPPPGIMDETELMNLVQAKLEMKEAEDEKWHTPYGESTYAFLYMSKSGSAGFWFGVAVYVVQIATISLTLIDIIDPDDSLNPLSVPVMVDLTVTCAQAITIGMLLAFMSDLMEAVLKIQDGFYPVVLETHPGATYPKWLFSCLAQMAAGLLLLVTSFILTMQSASVIDLMLNMTALLFMAEIDDLSFTLAHHGFFTDKLEMEAESVANFKVPKQKRRNLYRRILFGIILALLFLGYAMIKQREMYGYYLPKYIYVQYGDAYNPKIPYYSGLMKVNDARKQGYREYRDLGTDNVLLTYCDPEHAWTFTDNGNPCDFFARTTETEEFDVTAIPDSEWMVADSQKRLHPFSHFSLVRRDCDLESCQGECVNGICECPHYLFGIDCEFSSDNVCPTIILDTRFGPFPPATLDYNGNLTKFAVSDEFDILKNPETGKYVKVYDMPVFYSNRTFPANVIFFGGRRWIFTSEWDLIDFWKEAHASNMTEMFFPQKTVEALERSDFHAFKGANYTPIFFSDPVDYETPSFLPTPGNLGWWTARIRSKGEMQNEYEPDYALETRLTCQSCLASQGGYCDSAGGTCNETSGLCECQADYFGDKCELQPACYEQDLPCTGHGVCDHNTGVCTCHSPWYNKLCFHFQLCINEDGRCQNGGVCNQLTWECECPADPALDGQTCERYLDCRLNGCANGGICGQDGKCLCRPPFEGVLCNLVDSTQTDHLCTEDSDCSNGICNTVTGICTCNDPAAFGARCEYTWGCGWGGCRNGGICTETGICQCPEPFFGPDCSQEPVCTDDAYCLHFFGRDTVCDHYTGTCMCGVPGPRSKMCFHRNYNCKHVGCNGRGTCLEKGRCECRYPYAGRTCEYALEEFYTDQSEFRDLYYDMLNSCIAENGYPPYPPNIQGCYYLFGG